MIPQYFKGLVKVGTYFFHMNTSGEQGIYRVIDFHFDRVGLQIQSKNPIALDEFKCVKLSTLYQGQFSGYWVMAEEDEVKKHFEAEETKKILNSLLSKAREEMSKLKNLDNQSFDYYRDWFQKVGV